MIATLATLTIVFVELSLLAFGGGNSILPEMHRQAVEVQHWMTAEQFNDLFAIAQAAPGPNLMIAPLVGWQVAGLAGVAAVSLALFAPAALLAGLVAHAIVRFQDTPLLEAIKKGMAPVTAGLVAASAFLIAQNAVSTASTTGIAVAVVVAGLTSKLHPLWLLAFGACAGIALAAV